MRVRVAINAVAYRRRCEAVGVSKEDADKAIVKEQNGVVFLSARDALVKRLMGGRYEPGQGGAAAALSFLDKARNFAASAARHVAAGMPQASEEEVARRFAICQACEHYDGKACKQCGCPIVRQKKFLSKLSWANESCPVGKWGPVSG